ncbi:hypothetical protein [Budvicia aquatica]|uniref:hypothetical protein n=1 Tax=Budvicia aquatica TaxID=82979 RepID=UPI003D15A1C8
MVRKPPVPPSVRAGGAVFAGDSGFPKSGFEDGSFVFLMNGTDSRDNSNYVYTTNQPEWTSVSSTGVVSFNKMPTANSKAVTITITRAGRTQTFEFSLEYWFKPGRYRLVRAIAPAQCEMLGEGWSLTSVEDWGNAVPGDGSRLMEREPNGKLLSEWGVPQVSWWVRRDGQYHVAEANWAEGQPYTTIEMTSNDAYLRQKPAENVASDRQYFACMKRL